jgi:RNA polymerase-interacting CarD/CdnL/TRCF family regulator
MIFNVGELRSEEIWEPVEIERQSLKRIDECIQKEEILQKLAKSQETTIAELERSLAIAQKERDLEKRENELNLKIIGIKDKEIEGINRNFNQLKDVTDRGLKLAEMSKPKGNWEVYGIAGLALFLIGLLAGK